MVVGFMRVVEFLKGKDMKTKRGSDIDIALYKGRLSIFNACCRIN